MVRSNFKLLISLWASASLTPTLARAGSAGPAETVTFRGDQSHVYLKLVEVVGGETGAGAPVEISFELECGETFHGVIVSPKNQQQIVHMGVVVDRSQIGCSSIPRTVSTMVPVSFSGTQVKPFAMEIPKRIQLREVSQASVLDDPKRDHKLTVTWQDNCMAVMGLMLTPSHDGGQQSVGMNIAQLAPDSSSRSSFCVAKSRQMAFEGMTLLGQNLHLNHRPGSIQNLYELELKSPQKVITSDAMGMSVEWQQTCRERAVGVVFMGPKGQEVALLTAFAPNVPCLFHGTRRSTYQLHRVGIEKKATLSIASSQMLHARVGKNWRSLQISAIDLPNLQRRAGFHTKSKTCSQSVGLAVSADDHGQIAVGQLSLNSDHGCSSLKPIPADLRAPLIAVQDHETSMLRPLKIFGTALN